MQSPAATESVTDQQFEWNAQTRALINQRLKELKIRRSSLAKALDCDRSTVSNYLNGRRTPSEAQLKAILMEVSLVDEQPLGYLSKITARIRELGITNREVARSVRASDSEFSRYMSGDLKMSLHTFASTLIKLKLSADWVLFGHGSKCSPLVAKQMGVSTNFELLSDSDKTMINRAIDSLALTESDSK